MAKLYFYYSTMNAGKSTLLLQANYNYIEKGMKTFLLSPYIDSRKEQGKIYSRIGISRRAETYKSNTDLFNMIEIQRKKVDCVLVDEAQFLSKNQVIQLTNIVDYLNIPVLTYGLKSDFQAESFEGSKYLLIWSDKIIEVKTICHCGRKSTHVLRLNKDTVVRSGSQIHIGGEESYSSVCRKHFKEGKF